MNERRRNDVIANVISQSSLNTMMVYHDSDRVKQKEVMIVEKQAQHDNNIIHPSSYITIIKLC